MTEQDTQIVDKVRHWLEKAPDPVRASLIEIIDRLDKQNTAVLGLLERVVDIDNAFDNNDPDKVLAWGKLTGDTKTLLKEAKEE